jgi:PKHD-type hydroxylase
MNKIWQMWSGEIDDKTVSDIITECEYYSPQQANIGYDDGTVSEQTRRSEVRWIDKNDVNSKFIADMMWRYVQEANRNAFGFHIDYFSEIQYTTYFAENSGKYDWHHDTFWGNTSCYDRKVSIILQLSDPSEYTGGEFQLDPQYEQPQQELLKRKGTILAFPSFIRHRVTEIESGVRKSLVMWVEGPKFR